MYSKIKNKTRQWKVDRHISVKNKTKKISPLYFRKLKCIHCKPYWLIHLIHKYSKTLKCSKHVPYCFRNKKKNGEKRISFSLKKLAVGIKAVQRLCRLFNLDSGPDTGERCYSRIFINSEIFCSLPLSKICK